MKMNVQEKIDALNQEIHNLWKKNDILQCRIGAKIEEVRKLERSLGIRHFGTGE